LVNRAQKKPEGLLDRLVALVDVASSGLNLEPEKRQKKRRRPQTEVKKGKGGAKASGKKEGQKGSASGPSTGKGSDLPAGSSWAHIVKGKKVSGDFQGPIFRLRPEDWADFHVVSHVNQFGTLVDKCGKAKPFVFLVKHQDQLDEAVALVAGDADIKATLLFVLGFGAPLELIGKERESKVPLVDAAGKVSTRKVQCLSNHNTFDQSKVRVVVPVDKRPPVTTRETSKLDTLVIRLSLDKRFTDTKAWNKICQNPGVVARAWMKDVAPVCQPFLQDTWGWELLPGSGGADTVIKGLVRVKKKDQLTHLLAASGKVSQEVRVFLDPLDWTLTPKTWGKRPYVSWVEKRPKEDDQAYMARAAKLNVNCGLARGWRQIGVRSLTEVPTTPVVPVRTWILKSAPRYWTMEQVTNFLEASNFGSIGFVSKKWEKFGTSWIFKGQRD